MTFYQTVCEGVSSRLLPIWTRVVEVSTDGRLISRAFFWYIWFMIVMATISTLALWASLDANYGHSEISSRHVRDTSESVGLLDSLWWLSGRFDVMLSGSRTVDIKTKKNVFGPVCPEIDIPGSGKNMTHKLNETTLFHVEEEVLQTFTIEARKLNADGNSRLQRLLRKQGNSHTSVSDVLSVGLEMDDYILLPGGRWIPTTCTPRWKVAIVVPFRDRHYHLPILLRHLVPFLKSQYLEFGIYVVEQANSLRFNRAMLMNVGFAEALNFTTYDCFIFHDVDHIPLSYGNYYGCSAMPRHFVSGVDRWKYKLLYGAFFGAVTGFTRSQIERFNGFPNVYWGWGGEDDDILGRIRSQGLAKTRPWGPVGFYNVIPHHHKSAKKNMDRVCLLTHHRERIETDGLSNLSYRNRHIQLLPLYTNVSVDIRALPYNKDWHVCDREAEMENQDQGQNGPGEHKVPIQKEYIDKKAEDQELRKPKS
ncbi:beta-1,4-galactosyltransferase 5-like [Diadema antillarum]|uniref:beta-1,4-galactosyltransferase 5-like n=1 Tax=Diadema antillarum TaxID=105358 RepID=UPI003A84D037